LQGVFISEPPNIGTLKRNGTQINTNDGTQIKRMKTNPKKKTVHELH